MAEAVLHSKPSDLPLRHSEEHTSADQPEYYPEEAEGWIPLSRYGIIPLHCTRES